MSKLKLEYDLPEEKKEALIASASLDTYYDIFDLREKLHKELKHGTIWNWFNDYDEIIEYIISELSEILNIGEQE